MLCWLEQTSDSRTDIQLWGIHHHLWLSVQLCWRSELDDWEPSAHIVMVFIIEGITCKRALDLALSAESNLRPLLGWRSNSCRTQKYCFQVFGLCHMGEIWIPKLHSLISNISVHIVLMSVCNRPKRVQMKKNWWRFRTFFFEVCSSITRLNYF